MSRIEKAIELAARQRNAADTRQNSGEAATAPSGNAAVEAPLEFQLDTSEKAPAPLPEAGRAEQPQQAEALPPLDNHCLVMANAPNSPAAEQYRKLKSNIMKQVKAGKGKPSFLVTSPMAGEGKSVTALNLAISLAQDYDHTVLLVEADLRKPSVLKYLGLQTGQGLSDCVLDGVDVDSVLIPTGIGSLSVLPAGRPVDNPVELFSSRRMQELITEVNDRYPNRIVIVDTTPLLPFAEAQYLAGIVGGIILVVRERLTSLDKLKRALELLKNQNLIGVVCNGVNRAASSDGYHGYYGYRY